LDFEDTVTRLDDLRKIFDNVQLNDLPGKIMVKDLYLHLRYEGNFTNFCGMSRSALKLFFSCG
jgi:hypothetical protein